MIRVQVQVREGVTLKPAQKPKVTGLFLFLPLTAPLSTILTNRFGHRLVVMGGGLLISVGMIAASFSQRVYQMYISIGIVSGECLSSANTLWACVHHVKKGGMKRNPDYISSPLPPLFFFLSS